MHPTEILDAPTLERNQDAFVESVIQLEQAARILDLEDWVVERLRHPGREVSVNLPLIRDNGSAATITGYRVQHCGVRGPALGGLRLCSDASLTETRARAMATTWQLALLDVPFGGSAGAIVCDPAKLSERELRHIVKEYATALRGILGAHSDVILEDEGANPQILAWILDACKHNHGHLDPASAIGKPKALFGIEGHGEALAHGIATIVERVAANRKLASARVAIQDRGEYGHALAHACDQRGMQLVALADSSGGIYRPSGIAISSLDAWLSEHGMLTGYPDAEGVYNTDVLECACDVLIAAVPGNPINAAIAENIHASVVVEGVYGAISAPAIDLLEAGGATVMPYLLAGAGGMAHACLEWTVNTSGHMLLTGEAEEHLQRRLLHAYSAANNASMRHEVTLREGAHVAAIELIAEALRLH